MAAGAAGETMSVLEPDPDNIPRRLKGSSAYNKLFIFFFATFPQQRSRSVALDEEVERLSLR
jgi:hypothetical protein